MRAGSRIVREFAPSPASNCVGLAATLCPLTPEGFSKLLARHSPALTRLRVFGGWPRMYGLAVSDSGVGQIAGAKHPRHLANLDALLDAKRLLNSRARLSHVNGEIPLAGLQSAPATRRFKPIPARPKHQPREYQQGDDCCN